MSLFSAQSLRSLGRHFFFDFRLIAALPLPLRKGSAFPIEFSKDLAAMPPEAEPQEKLNALTESQRLSARTAAKPRQADALRQIIVKETKSEEPATLRLLR